jgi:hypothetical protein
MKATVHGPTKYQHLAAAAAAALCCCSLLLPLSIHSRKLAWTFSGTPKETTPEAVAAASEVSISNLLRQGEDHMISNTTIRSPGAISLGAFFAGVTGYVLFKDVLDGAAITTNHVLALAALVAAISSGHLAWPALRSGQIVLGLLLAVLFIGSTGYVVVSSGARNAETAGTKAAKIADTNDARARELKQLARAEGMLSEAERKLDKDCVKGKASKGTCDGIRATLAVYSAAIRGHKSTLRDLGPELAPSGGYAHAAKVLVAAGVPGTAEDIEARLVLLLPFVTVLIAELGTIAFMHMGLGHQHRPAPARQAPQERQGRPIEVRPDPTPPAPTSPPGGRRKRLIRKEQARADVLEFRRPVAQRDLADRWGVGKSMVSMWLDEFEAEGLVQRVRHGREVVVHPMPRLRAVA